MPTGDHRDSAQRHGFTLDVDLQLKDAGAITSSAAAQVGGSDKVLDLGEAFVQGQVWIDLADVEFGDADETYELHLQFSDGSDFTSDDVFSVALMLGDARNGFSDQSKTGQKLLPFNNRFLDSNGEVKNFRYMRMYTVVGGTTPSVNYEAYVVKLD